MTLGSLCDNGNESFCCWCPPHPIVGVQQAGNPNPSSCALLDNQFMCWLPHKTVVINAAPTNEGAFVLMGCVKQTFRFFSLVAGTKKRLCVFATEHKNDFRTDRKFYVFTFMCFMFCVFVFLGMLQYYGFCFNTRPRPGRVFEYRIVLTT